MPVHSKSLIVFPNVVFYPKLGENYFGANFRDCNIRIVLDYVCFLFVIVCLDGFEKSSVEGLCVV